MSEIFRRLPEADIRKGISIKLLPDTRNEFRQYCVSKGLSMQETLEEFAQRIVSGDAYMLEVVEDLIRSKREKEFKKLSAHDAEAIFNILEYESPLND